MSTSPKKCKNCGAVLPDNAPCQCPKDVIKIDYPDEGGIFTYMQGYKYPYKGFPDEAVIKTSDAIKRSVVVAMKILVAKPVLLILVWSLPFILFFRKKLYNLALDAYSEVAHAGYHHHYLAPNRFCPSMNELMRAALEVFPSTQRNEQCIIGVGMMLQFDNAYRFRTQDAIPLIRQNKLTGCLSTRKEIIRALKIAIQREKLVMTEAEKEIHKKDKSYVASWYVDKKWKALLFLARLILLDPFINKWVRTYLSALNYEKVSLDRADWYFCCERNDYDFGGLSYKERLALKEKEDADWNPEPQKKKAQVAMAPNEEFYLLPRDEAEKVIEGLLAKLWNGYENKVKIKP